MLISRTWLQSYFNQALPDAHSIAHTLLLHSFEIEGVNEKENDSIIDIDVLPNRAHDCLCHRGIAQELSGLLSYPMIQDRFTKYTEGTALKVKVTIENTHKCRCYTAFYAQGVTVRNSPQWLADALTTLGQKSINTIVDATNYVMFDCGQPLHAFDADKVVGGITVRDAHEGETMTTLGGETLTLTSDDLVIADDEGVLALAGVKGGIKAEVTSDTKNIIVEIANFEPISVRHSSRRHKIQTDSSKRFENEISIDLTTIASGAIQKHISNLSDTEVTYSPCVVEGTYTQAQHRIHVTKEKVDRVLGLDIPSKEILDLFGRFAMKVSYDSEVFEVTVPQERLDIRISEDVIEEIGRWYGYHRIPSISVSALNFTAAIDARTYYENSLKNILIAEGYTELLTYAFTHTGEVTLYNPLGKDKSALRTELISMLETARDLNLKNASFFGTNHIGVFEIGRVYHADSEVTMCSISCCNVDKKARKELGDETHQLEALHKVLQQKLGISFEVNISENTMSFSLDEIASNNVPQSYGDVFDPHSYASDARYKGISVYPYSTRDISLWVSEGVTENDIKTAITNSAGEYLIKCYLFDEFSKEERTSFAFSLVFQSSEKTLEEGDVDTAMKNISTALEQQGWEIR